MTEFSCLADHAITRVSDHNGISQLYTKLEIHHPGHESSNVRSYVIFMVIQITLKSGSNENFNFLGIKTL